MSCAPDLEEEKDQNEREGSPNRQNYFLTIVPDDGYIVRDIWIAIEKLVSPPKDENAGKQEDNHCDGERDT